MDRMLGTYLNDHLTASLAAGELARRSAHENAGTRIGESLAKLAAEIDEERTALRSIMAELGIGADPVKLGAGWMAEKLGRLKLNGRLLGYSPLSRLEEVELLLLGVEGKLLLWETLGELSVAQDLEPSLDQLTSRARSQRRMLRRLRLQAVQAAFPG
jgi:hypothetical protein